MIDNEGTDYLITIQFLKRLRLEFDCVDLNRIDFPFKGKTLEFHFTDDGRFNYLEQGP